MASTLVRAGPVHLCPYVLSPPSTAPTTANSGKNTANSGSLVSRDVSMEDIEVTEKKRTSLQKDSSDIFSGSSGTLVWNVDNIFQLINEATENARLMRVLYSTFSGTKALLRFFKLPETASTSPASANPDKEKVKMTFHQIISKLTPPTINCVMTSTACLIDTLKLQQKYDIDDFISICVLLCNPALLDSNYHSTVLIRLCDLLAGFHANEEICDAFELQLIRFFNLNADTSNQKVAQLTATGGRKDLQMLVGIIQHFITMRIYTLTSQFGYPPNPNKDEAIVNATKSLSLFYQINEKLKIISYEEFYNEAVNENLEIKEDFPHWKAKEGFSFCNYPFILNPSIKSDILKVESMVQMRHELQDSFFRAMFVGVNSPYLVLEIRRDHIIRDALYQLENKRPEDLKKQLKIQFVGEEAVDEGGVQKEFFQLAIRDIFSPQYNLFTILNNYHWFTVHPAEVDSTLLEEMRLVGMLIGLAIYNGVILDVKFPLPIYQKLINIPIGLDELVHIDPVLARSLKFVQEYDGDVENDLGRSFVADLDIYNEKTTVELIPNGDNVPLTKLNREEFVKLYVDLILYKSVDAVFSAFKDGFYQVCKNSAITLFRAEELELLLCGSSGMLNFEELKAVTTYDGGYSAETPVIQFFWNTVLKLNEEQKKRLLFFATGTDRIPIGGLSKMTFCIAKNGGDSDRLPTSHTCFNVLLLPEYKEESRMSERLLTAIQNAEGFGMI